jgi:type VI secretion system protein ImpK
MNTTASGEALLLRQFREFYQEVIRLKQMVTAGVRTAPLTPAAAEGQGDVVHTVRQRLLSLLERQALMPRWRSTDYGVEYFKEAQYVMAALADEIFLNLDWEGREAWTSHLLESKLFHTHVAGELFFQKVEQLLQSRDPVNADLAAVYFMALALGFRGKYQGPDGAAQLERYRRRLFAFIFQRHPNLQGETRLLFPQAYAYTLDQADMTRLADPRMWMVALGLLALTWLAVSHVLWAYLTSDLAGVIQQILALR